MTPMLRFAVPLLFATTAVLAQSADVSVQVSGQQTADKREFHLLYALVNHGPDIARQTVVTIDVPAGVVIERVSLGSGDVIDTCDANARPVRCEAGDVHVGLLPHYGGMVIRTPIADARYEVKVTASSPTGDPKPANNSGSISFETKVEADVEVAIFPRTDRADPGGTGTFTVYVCNNTPQNQPATVRVELTPENGLLTSVKPASGFTCRSEVPNGKVVCTIPELPYGCPESAFDVTVRATDDRGGGVASVNVAATGDLTDPRPENNRQAKGFAVYRWIAVTTTADSGPGSLRDAITQANEGCSPGPCRVVFEIPKPVPAEGYFTITPQTPLPSVTAERVSIEGSRQTAFTGETNPRGPEIAIDGRHARRGMRMLARCEAVVDGLAIGNFEEDQGLWFSAGGVQGCGNRPDRREITKNHIGMDPLGLTASPNRRGLRLDFTSGVTVMQNVIARNTYSGIWLWRGDGVTIKANYFELNGASAILLGPEVISAFVYDNVIRNHPHMGVAIAPGANMIAVRRNRMRGNGGLGIDWGLDGVSPVDDDDHGRDTNAPVVLSAVYNAQTNETNVTFTIKTAPLGPYLNFGDVDIFTNDGPEGDGETPVASFDYVQKIEPGQTRTLSVPGDHRGKWINMTWTRRHEYAAKTPPIDTQSHEPGFGLMTSELSNSVLAQ